MPASASRPSVSVSVAVSDFKDAKRRMFRLLLAEQRTKRQVLASLERTHGYLRATFLRGQGTTYQAWCDLGPKALYDEVVAAAEDDAVWDRLVERDADRKDDR